MTKENLNIGILIINKKNNAIGYSQSKGFFMIKESFSLKELSSDTLWFSNLPRNIEKDKNIKSIDFFGNSLSYFFNYEGLKITPKTKELTLIKMYDFIFSIVKNGITQFSDKELEKINNSVERKRISDRIKILTLSDSYVEFLLGINNKTKETDKINLKNKNVLIKGVYSLDSYKDETKNNIIFNKLKINEIDRKKLTVYSNKKNKVKILTLDSDNIKSVESKILYKNNCYEWYALKEKNQLMVEKILKRDDLLFIKIELRIKNEELKVDLPNIYKILNRKEIIVTKEELIWYVSLDWFNIEIQEYGVLKQEERKKLNKIRNIEKERDYYKSEMIYDKFNEYETFLKKLKKENIFNFDFNTNVFSYSFNEELSLNKLQNFIHCSNYLQIVFLNDNFLLNEWIKSQLIMKNLKIVKDLSLKEIEVVSFDYKSITIAIEDNEKEDLRIHLERLDVNYPAILL